MRRPTLLPPALAATGLAVGSVLLGAVVVGCGSSVAARPTVTVTSTVIAANTRAPAVTAPPLRRSTPAAPTTTPRGAPGSLATPAKASPTASSTDAAGDDTPTAHGAGAPPGSLSTDGNLLSAAVSAAAAAGVAPADPDTPGPDGGPKCGAADQYVDETTAGLRADVAAAWKQAVAAARADGVTVCLNDGKRSRAQQRAQFDDYVRRYGAAVAEELVLPPDKSAHVVGIAVDVQPASAYRWLQASDGALGFCRIYDNEPWHFEFNPAYRGSGCPARLPEPLR